VILTVADDAWVSWASIFLVPIGAFLALVHHCTLIFRHRRFEVHRVVSVEGKPSVYAPVAAAWNITLLSLIGAVMAAGAGVEIAWSAYEQPPAWIIAEIVLALMNCIALFALCVVGVRRRMEARKAAMTPTDSMSILQGA
jgi:hypothetical protein